MKTADTMLLILKLGFVVGVVLTCTEVLRTCNNCYVPSPSLCQTYDSPNILLPDCKQYLITNNDTKIVTWTATAGTRNNVCQQYNCDKIFKTSILNTITYSKHCNADCNSITLSQSDGRRVVLSEPTVNVTSTTEEECINMCVEIAFTGVNCIVSYRGSNCSLYEESKCSGGLCGTEMYSGSIVVSARCNFTVCPRLTNPVGASVNYSGFVVGRTATFTCKIGYVASQLTVTCQSNGTWTSENFTCQPFDCQTPNAPLNGTVSAPLTTYPETATYSCNSGYNMSGQNLTTCQANRTWSGTLPTCNPLDCETPQVHINGTFITSGTTYLHKAVYTCNPGHVLIGEPNRTCQANMTWSGLMPTCLFVDCGQPPFPSNGSVQATITTYSHQARYECNFGYRLEGHNTSVCLSNGSWSDTVPSCVVINCTFLTSPGNGSIDFTETIYMAKAEYFCDTGYNLIGQNVRICQDDDTWNGTDPRCDPVDCGSPWELMNGSVSVGDTTYLKTAVYQCNPGFLLSGKNTSVCKADGFWSTVGTFCDPVDCGNLTNPENGIVSVIDTTFTSVAFSQCNFGYRLEGNNTTMCLSNGSWGDNLPSCEVINCTIPTPPGNGSVNSTGTMYMARALYYCDTGYNLIGKGERFCQNDDSWNGTVPRCDPVDCGNRTAPINGSVIVRDTTYLNTAVYLCDPGFLLVGQNASLCQANGSWNVEVPFCDPVDCGNLTDPVNGKVSVTETTYTSVASYHCTFGYRMDGENMTECLSNSSWSNAKPNCTMIGCGPLNNPDNGFVSMPEGTDIWAQASYSCKPGFKRSHSLVRTCSEKKQWTGKEPTCEKRIYKKIYIVPCLCYPNKTFQNMTTKEILEKLENDTKIDPKKTAVARSKLESRHDPRQSSAIIGAVGITVLASVFGLIICVDLNYACKHFKGRKGRKSR